MQRAAITTRKLALTLALLTALFAVTFAAACGSDSDTPEVRDPNLAASPRDALKIARDLWEANGSDNYDIRLGWLCFCPVDLITERTIEVRNNAVASGGFPVESGTLAEHQTVDGLFNLIEDALDRDAATLDISYHPTLGYPTQGNIDYDLRMADEEIGFTVHDLALR